MGGFLTNRTIPSGYMKNVCLTLSSKASSDSSLNSRNLITTINERACEQIYRALDNIDLRRALNVHLLPEYALNKRQPRVRHKRLGFNKTKHLTGCMKNEYLTISWKANFDSSLNPRNLITTRNKRACEQIRALDNIRERKGGETRTWIKPQYPKGPNIFRSKERLSKAN